MGYDDPGRHAPVEPSSGVPAAVLENVFDDPDHGEPGRDRLAVHVAWEVALAAGLAVLAWLLWQADPAVLREPGLRILLVDVVALGLLALAAGVSLRTAAVNLAIGPVAVAAALHLAEQGDRGIGPALGQVAAAAALGGLALGLAVAVLHVPGWAASLAGAAGVVVYIERRAAPVLVQSGYDPRGSAFYLFAGFAAVAVLGGLFGAIRPVRRLVGRFRPVVDPARRRGAVAATVSTLACVVSTVLAALAGVLIATNGEGAVAPTAGLDWTVLGVGAALLAGTSAYGRRGGMFGTLLAVSLIGVLLAWADTRGWVVSRWAVGGAALGVGLLVTRLVEAYGRPYVVGADPEPLGAADPSISSGWSVPRLAPMDDWPPALPVRTDDTPTDPWQASRWETRPPRWDGGDR
ncbi:ABC transporter permease [Micromonospora olivasterospora]|uniref:Monosaccharide ABC transporter membrane protein, CUT2 family (TC 3.A.1.2.-) n=1 Tax=Micromonospora olivasterospora TaxID=1880 RepID=A0A562I8C7_MICOL|nr:ABC transporter permease [Micromonospora olivasterospora]TWH66975.1 monosaccharide ABC transporter membrane protein, CUT2 family (TC 3.A.1.2.-) [Micromonospora olivasterospora]